MTYLTNLEGAVHICVLIILSREIKKITNEIKVKLENLENSTKEGIHQLKATVQHLSKKILTLETKLAHPKEDPVVEVMEKVKQTENQNKLCDYI